MKRNGVVLCVATLAAAAAPSAAVAQGFGLNEIGSCAIGRGFAVTGTPCRDASAIFWNPAATTTLDKWSLLVGAAAVDVKGNFTSDYLLREEKGDVPLVVPPHFFGNWKATPELAVGLGVYIPYGLTNQWKPNFSGRFAAQKASLASIYVQPNVAYDIVPGRLSIGGGPVIGHSTVELRQALDLSQQVLPNGATFAALGIASQTEFGRAQLKGSATAYGFNVGISARPLPTVQLGVRYLSKLDFKYKDARATFRQTTTGLVLAGAVPNPANPTGPPLLPAGTVLDTVLAKNFIGSAPLTSQKVSTNISHPAQLQFGVGFSGLPSTTISVDAAWIGWSVFNSLPVNFANPLTPDRLLLEEYEDGWSVRGGIEYRFDFGLTGRAGISYAPTPAPDVTVTPLLPDMDRTNYALGFGLPIGARYAIDAAYLRVDTRGRRGRIAERLSTSQTAEQLNSGFYRLDANIFSVSFKATY